MPSTAKFPQRLELAANALVILVAVLLAVTLIQNNCSHSAQGEANGKSKSRESAIGRRIDLPSDLLTNQTHAVVLGLDIRCRFCRESSEFYKRLVAAVSGSNVRVVAYFASPPDEGKEYLAGLGIEGLDVRQTRLSDINVRGTPTIHLVDRTGTIINSWVGKIPAEKEPGVIESIIGAKQ